MKALQKIGYSTLGFLALNSASAINFGGDKVSTTIKGDDNTADVTIQNLVGNAMLFLGIVAVLFGIYGGFKILTAGGDDGKVKAGKTILIQALLGLVVIFLANSIVQFVLNNILGGSSTR